MKLVLALIGLFLVSCAVFGVRVATVNAQDTAKCEHSVSDSKEGRFGLIVCEPGKELPADVKEIIPEPLWDVQDPSAFDGGSAVALGGGSNIALFHCSNGDPCSANGWGYGGIYIEWYRFNSVQMGTEYEVCWQPQGCPFYTYYWPDTNHRGHYVTSNYTNYITTCWCDGGYCEMP